MGRINRNLKPLLVLVAGLGLAILAPSPRSVCADLRDEMIAKAKEEGTFLLAGSNADNLRDKLAGFRKRYPFITIKAYVANTTDTVNRTFAEARSGRLSIDMVATSSDGMELLAKGKLLEKLEFPHLKDISSETQPRHGLYLQLFLGPRVQGVYNKIIIAAKDLPTTWEAMLDPKWAGKTMISRTSDNIPAELAYLWSSDGKLNWERSFDFFTRLMAQKPKVARGYRGGTNQVAAGEAGIMWFSSVGPAARLADRGAPVGLIAFPKFAGSFRSYGVLKGAKHPASSWLFIDYLSSPEGQFEYTENISSRVPVNKRAKIGKLGQWLVEQGATVENTVPLDAELIFDKAVQKKSADFFFKIVGIK